MALNQQNTSHSSASTFNIREELEKYLRYWPLFLISVVIALAVAYFKLRQITPIYSSTATIIMKESKNNQSPEMAAFADMGMFGGNANSIEDEIGILRSRRMMESVVKALNLNVRYYDEEQLRRPELYNDSPFVVKVMMLDEEKLQQYSANFRLRYKGNSEFEMTRLPDGNTITTNFGSPVDLDFARILVVRNPGIPEENIQVDRPIVVSFGSTEKIARSYSNNLDIRLKERNSRLVELGINDPVRAKAEDILDQLVLEYNRETIEDKNLVARNTADFISERLEIINEELDSVETGKVEFKENNRLTDIQAESQLFIANASDFKRRQQEIGTQIELAEAMIAYLETSTTSDLLPANLGIEESAVNQEIEEYNQLVLERNRILRGSTAMNPVVIRLDRQIEELQANVLQSLSRLRSNLQIAEENLDQQAAVIGSQISAVPSQEKQFRGIERQQQIKESLYLFLLQKREENSLSLAVTAPKAKIVDSALSSDFPISPNSRNMYLSALLFGLGVPFSLIYLKNLLNNKVRSRADIENVSTEIPIVGEIPRIGKTSHELIQENDRSVLAESFRILHTNLQYLLVNSGDKDTGISILVTSSIKGEGKTFTAFNLAMTLANTGKKVIIAGGDLRNPQLQRYERNSKSFQGIADYLVNNELQLKKLIKRSSLHNSLDLLASGNIPPNPSELLRQEKAKQMFKELESMYDYVIIDTAPAMLVADTFLINQYADLTLYVARAGYTKRKLLDFPIDAKKDGKLTEVSFVLNNVESANFGYGNKYGYAYGEQKTNFWDRLKERAAFW